MKQIKYIITICLSIASSLAVFGQLSEGGEPPSFRYKGKLRSTVALYEVAVDNFSSELNAESRKAVLKKDPSIFARVIPVDIDIARNGTWAVLPDSQKVWRYTISAKDAQGIILSYKDFYIPKGGKLFIYNKDQSHLIGSFTHNTNPKGGTFSTEAVHGDELTLEYVASGQSDELPRIAIKDIGYVIRSVAENQHPDSYWLGKAWPCMTNVNCEDGRNWQNQKRGVVAMIFKRSDNWWVASSASLINNTANDGKPYILTANHNMEHIYKYLDEVAFYFNYEYPGCQNLNVMPSTTKTLIGCEILVDIPIVGGSDGTLLKIKNVETVPKEWKPYYNGWDISNTPSSSGAVIHHPHGDVKKITLYDYKNNKTITTTTLSSEHCAPNAHWQVSYNGVSVTQPGSSGSPIFNDKGFIIGTLTAGASTCEQEDLYEADYYGKMWYHWDKYTVEAGKPEQKMKTFLDPSNKNVTSLKGYDPNGLDSVIEPEQTDKLELIVFPNPAESELNINSESIIRSVKIFNIQGRKVFTRDEYSSSTISLPVEGWPSGVYQIILETEHSTLKERFIKK